MAFPSGLSRNDIELMGRYYGAQARRSLWAYRQLVNPTMRLGWFQRDVAQELQRFFQDWRAGKRPILLIQAPPQHGKTSQVLDALAWAGGHWPDTRMAYASYSSRLGIRANLGMRRLLRTPRHSLAFPGMLDPVSWPLQETTEFFELAGGGSFRNTTVNGPITGEGFDLMLLDDPIKGRREARSSTVRDSVWEWFQGDLMTRFSDGAGLLGIMTRWHVDDPFARIIRDFPNARVLSYPAIAPADDEFRKEGEALFPEHKSLDFLNVRRASLHPIIWSALYQQNPVVEGGEVFDVSMLRRYRALPRIVSRFITADTAQKEGQRNDFTVFQCWGIGDDGSIYLLDMMRDKWDSVKLLDMAQLFWARHAAVKGHGVLREFLVEDKSSGTGLIQQLRRGDPRSDPPRPALPVRGIPRSIDKYSRALDVAPMISAGRVYVPESAPWLLDLIQEMTEFPGGTNDDTVDPLMDAIEHALIGVAGRKTAGVW